MTRAILKNKRDPRGLSFKIINLSYFSIILMSYGNTVFAQSNSPSDVVEISDDIVVTAQKRSETSQQVPIAITAISGKQMAEQNIRSAIDVVSGIANLRTQSPLGDGIPVFAMRGISMSDFSFSQNGPIAVYYDEVYHGSFPLMGLGIYDLERVEVLKGPQSTLYGKNTTGGAINFISHRPDFVTEGYLSLGFGNYEHYQADGAFQTALGDKVASRTAFTIDRADGWFKNHASRQPDLASTRQYAIRQSFLLKPSDDVSVLLRGATSLQNPINYGIGSLPADGDGIGAYYSLVGIEPDFRAGFSDREGDQPEVFRRRARTYSLSATVIAELNDALTLTSITAYENGKLRVHEDSDGSYLRVAELDYNATAKQLSQELRLAGNIGNQLEFTAGAFWNRERIRNATTSVYFEDFDADGNGVVDFNDCVATGFFACKVGNRFRQQKESLAVYLDANYAITGNLKLRGGLRYTHDKAKLRDFTAYLSGTDDVPIANTIPGSPVFDAKTSLDHQNSNVSGRIGLDFQASRNILLYGSYSRGYRGAAFNAQAFADPSELTVATPEKVESYEVGAKTDLFNRILRLNVAAFWYNYRNQQVLDVDPATLTTPLINLPKSRIRGVEIEGRLRATRMLTLSGSAGLLDTEIREGTSFGFSLRGNRLITAPKLTLSGGIDWDIQAGTDRVIKLHGDVAYSSRQYYDLFNSVSQKGYALLNGSISYEMQDEGLTFTAWARNMTDKKYVTNIIDASGLGFIYRQIGVPRMYGVTARKAF